MKERSDVDERKRESERERVCECVNVRGEKLCVYRTSYIYRKLIYMLYSLVALCSLYVSFL